MAGSYCLGWFRFLYAKQFWLGFNLYSIEVHNWPIDNSNSSFFYYRFVNKETEIPGKGDRQFIRKGVVGDWKNHFSPESSAEWDQWIAKEFQGTGIQAAFDNE